MAADAFEELTGAFFRAKENGLTECALLEIEAEDYRQASEVLGKNIRQTDYMGMMSDGRFYILLSNTDEENAKGVAERFRSAGYGCGLREGEKDELVKA